MSEHEPEQVTSANPVLKVARDLSAIEQLSASLDEQAEHAANDPLMPGGLSMVALASVASPEAWEHVYEAAEHNGRDTAYASDQDDDWEPPLQSLLFWSEQWRVEHGYELDRRPTLASEASFIRWALNWAWDHEMHWDDFARDVNRARTRLENVLLAGTRSERSRVTCIETECERKPRLVKVYRDSAAEDHYRCPACKTRYTPQRFRMAKADLLASEDADRHVKMQDALHAIDRSDRTFRKWLRFWYVRSYRDGKTGAVMVWWPDVREMDLATPKRNRSAA